VNRGLAACGWAALGLVASVRVALAAGTPPIVRVYVAGPPEAVSGSRDAIQDLCARSNVAVVVRDAAGADEALLSTSRAPGLAEAYVDLRPGAPPRVVVVDAETRQDLERRSLPEGASLEISIETMAHVVCSAVESSLAARATPPVAPRPAEVAPRVARPEPNERWESRASLFASAANFGAGFRAGAGLSLSVSQSRAPWHWGGILSVSGFPAADVAGQGGLASFGLLGARVLPTLEWQASESVLAFVGLGAGVDWIRVAPERPPAGAWGADGGSSVDPIVSGMLGVRLRLARGVAALLAVDADVDLVRHRYVIETAQGNQAFFEPGRLRPVALAGLSLALGRADEPSQVRP
jgi:hypothetical protein